MDAIVAPSAEEPERVRVALTEKGGGTTGAGPGRREERPANLNNPERKRLPERMFRFGRDTGPDVAVSAADAAEKCATEDIFPVAFLFYHKFSYLWDVNVCNPTAYGDP